MAIISGGLWFGWWWIVGYAQRPGIGPLWGMLLKRAGLTQIQSRKEVNRLVKNIQSLGL
jgi:hypothetical protein